MRTLSDRIVASVAHEQITETPNGAYRGGRKFATQCVDMYFERIALNDIGAIHRALQRRSRNHATGTFGERAQHRKLSPRKVERLATPVRLHRDGIDGERSGFDESMRKSLRAALQCAHARGQLIEVEWFHEIVVGTFIQAAYSIRHGIARGGHQHRYAQSTSTQRTQHGQTIDTR